jgi:hypothetical protein
MEQELINMDNVKDGDEVLIGNNKVKKIYALEHKGVHYCYSGNLSMLDDLEAYNCIELPIKKWEPKKGGWRLDSDGDVRVATEDWNNNLGMIFNSKEEAQDASKVYRAYHRLYQYVLEFGGDWVADWNDHDQKKFFIVFDHDQKKWDIRNIRTLQSLYTNYMSYVCAIGLVKKLNGKEVDL